MKTTQLWLLGCALGLLVAGCDSGHQALPASRATTRATLTIRWPQAAPARTGRLMPKAAASIKVAVTGPFGFAASQTVDRPVGSDTSTVDFAAVPLGELTYTATAYPQPAAAGVAQATGSVKQTALAGKLLQVVLTMASTIDHLVVDPAALMVGVGQSKPLTATAYDAANAVVLLSADAVHWQSGDLGKATVDATGLTVNVNGVKDDAAPVTVTATDTESGKSASCAVTVVLMSPYAGSTNAKDGAGMVWVPEGDFYMGSVVNDSYNLDETPQHPVHLSGYWIYAGEVTVGMYKAFCASSGHLMPPPDQTPPWGWDHTDYPMTCVTYDDALAYATWAGVHLPSEAQWEKAARGSDKRTWPWGNDFDPTACSDRWTHTSGGGILDDKPSPVGSFSRDTSVYGARDMAGNAREWCSDWYGVYNYEPLPPLNPLGSATGTARIVRGGSWVDYVDYACRCAWRASMLPSQLDLRTGFRCMSLAPGP